MKRLSKNNSSDARLIQEIYAESHYNDQVFSNTVKGTYPYPLYGMDQIWATIGRGRKLMRLVPCIATACKTLYPNGVPDITKRYTAGDLKKRT